MRGLVYASLIELAVLAAFVGIALGLDLAGTAHALAVLVGGL